MKYAINQIYGPEFNRKRTTSKDVLILHQQRDQETGIEQKKAAIRRRKRETAHRIEHNQKMAEIVNLARKNVAEGKVIKVGV